MLKGQNGITLVALVITIIVLVILVGVTVSVAINDGIIGASQNAVKEYNEAQDNETKLINSVVEKINSVKSSQGTSAAD